MNKQHHHLSVREMSDQEVTNRYSKETLKLKTLNQFGRQSKRFLGYPNTLMMNLCKQELERRGLPIPTVSPQGKAPMTEQAYLAEVLRTYAGSEAQLDKLCLGALGLAGETGEI